MKSAFRIQQSELVKLQKAFDRLVARTGQKVTKQAVRAATQPLLVDMRASAPYRSGTLRKSVKKVVRGYRKNGIVVGLVGVSRGISGTHNGKRVVPANYAHLVEFGRKKVTAKNAKVLSSGAIVFGRTAKAAEPKPFIRPAYDRQEQRMKHIARSEVKKGVERVAKEVSR